MKNMILALLFILIAIQSFGQRKFGIKLYQNADRFQVENDERVNYTTSSTKSTVTSSNRVSMALNMYTKCKLVHEIEFLIPEVSKSNTDLKYPMDYQYVKDNAMERKASSYSIRYELNKTLTKASRRLGFNLGIGLNPYFVYVRYIPKVETIYYRETKVYGAALNVTPRITYRVSKRFTLDLNSPLKIYDLRKATQYIKNPVIPYAAQHNGGFINVFFEKAYTVRLGLLYYLNK